MTAEIGSSGSGARSKDILGLSCPAVCFMIPNVAESFLYDVRVVINFPAAHGTEKLQAKEFEPSSRDRDPFCEF